MHRVVALLAGVAVLAAGVANAAQPSARRYPPRYTKGTNFPVIVQKRHGEVVTKRVYPGYKNGFPPPAWLYYGYPHSGDGLVSPGF
jgi:hypothetical protein